MGNMEEINLFYALNDGYSKHCFVSMLSILDNNPDSFWNFYLMTDYISDENKGKLTELEAVYSNCKLHFHVVKETFSLPLTISYISQQTYYRYAIAEWFPRLEKAIYMDGDVVVKGSLKGFWDENIEDYLMGGVPDEYIEETHYKPEIGMSEQELYVNAGVLLMNLKRMREEGIYERLCDATVSLVGKIQYQDQDVINLVCRGSIKELDVRYNFTTGNALNSPELVPEAVNIHFTGSRKPWNKKCPNPLAGLYHKYVRRSPYCNTMLQRMCNRIFCAFNSY